MSEQPIQYDEVVLETEGDALHGVTLQVFSHDTYRKREPRPRTIADRLITLIMTSVNFIPNFLTWYSILSITGVGPATLYRNADSEALMIAVFVAQAFWILIFFLGIIVIMTKNLNWWQLCYQLEGVKEDRICRMMFFAIGGFTLGAEISFWVHFRNICAKNELISICSELSSDMSFAFTSITALVGLWTISQYNASFHKQLPYYSKEFSFISFPIIKVLCFNVPKVWLNSSRLISDLEIMLNLAETARNQSTTRARNGSTDGSLFNILKRDYDHLIWGWIEGMQLNELCELRKAFQPHEETLLARRPRDNDFRLFSEEDPVDIILKRVYLVAFFLLLSPLFAFLTISLIIFSIVYNFLIKQHEYFEIGSSETRPRHYLFCLFCPIFMIQCLMFFVIFLALLPVLLLDYYFVGIRSYLLDRYPFLGSVISFRMEPNKPIEVISWEPVQQELNSEEKYKIEEYLAAYQKTFLAVDAMFRMIRYKNTIGKETATKILSAIATLSPVLQDRLGDKVPLKKLLFSSLLKLYEKKLDFVYAPDKIKTQMNKIRSEIKQDRQSFLSRFEKEEEVPLCSPDLSDTLDYLIQGLMKDATISLYLNSYKTKPAQLGHKDANRDILSLLTIGKYTKDPTSWDYVYHLIKRRGKDKNQSLIVEENLQKRLSLPNIQEE